MSELIRTRCQEGQLIITEQAIIVELTGFGRTLKSETMLRSSFVDLDTKAAGWPLVRNTSFTFHGQGGKTIRAGWVKGEDAKRVIALLTGRS